MTGARSFSGFGFSWTPVWEKSVHPFSFLQPPFSFLQHKLGSSLNRLSVMAAPRRSVQPFPTLLSFCVGMRGQKNKKYTGVYLPCNHEKKKLREDKKYTGGTTSCVLFVRYTVSDSLSLTVSVTVCHTVTVYFYQRLVHQC